MLAYLASKPKKVPITQTCKPKKIYKSTTVPSQIYKRKVAQSQIPNIIFNSKSLFFLSLRCLFSIFYSPSFHNNPIQTPLSHHISIQLIVVGIFRYRLQHGSSDSVGRGYGSLSWVVGLAAWRWVVARSCMVWGIVASQVVASWVMASWRGF